MTSVLLLIMAALEGAGAYLAVWMLVGFTFRWVGLGGAALPNVVIAFLLTMHVKTIREAWDGR